MFVSFLGCDGSGKSAVIAGISQHLQADGISVTHGHWRPVATSFESTESSQTNADDPHGKKLRSTLSSILKLAWLWINWWFGWLSFLRMPSIHGIVLFDRYHADLLVDPIRYRYGGPMWLATLASNLMPQPDIVIFLDADPDILLSRKQEVSREALEKSRAAYLELAKSRPKQFRIIDASLPLEQVIAAVMPEICNPSQR